MKLNYAIVLAGGSGKRMGLDMPKQYAEVNGYPLLYYSLKAFQDCSFIDGIVLVTRREDVGYCRAELVEKYGFTKVRHIMAGGAQRYESVCNGLAALRGAGCVFVHDGARPCINSEILQKLYDDFICYGAAVAAVLSKDTVKISDSDNFAADTPERARVWIVQTPQVFDARELREAYDAMLCDEERAEVTDDASVMERYGKRRVHLCEASYLNIKVTTREDLITVGNFLQKISTNR
ncbi:MAG: 2-C-methyl-D-erythritol 4-phosphate cytidylyltransferase [Butyrivibrio sp.]|nr:2-C-methyl-D-erythritol 4-phosphate cytidylyltransferase [Butyrivibrio sp.]